MDQDAPDTGDPHAVGAKFHMKSVYVTTEAGIHG